MSGSPRSARTGPEVIAPTPEIAVPRLVRPEGWTFAFPAALAFLLLFYVLPLGAWLIRPLAARYLPWVSVSLASALILGLTYPLVWAALYYGFVPEEEGVLRDELPRRWWVLMQRRTGIQHWDTIGFRVCLLGTLFCLGFGGVFYAPAFLAAAVGFAGARRIGTADPWPLRHGARRITVPPPITEPAPEDAVSREFAWEYTRPDDLSVISNRTTLRISPAAVRALTAANPFAGAVGAGQLAQVVSRLVNEGVTFEVRELGRYLLEQAARHRLSVYEEIDNTLRLVQTAIEYKTDEETKGREYWRWPLETLYEQVGDCDCKSLLAAALLRTIFLLSPGSEPREVVLLVSEEERHMAVAVEGPRGLPPGYLRLDHRTYFFCESTAAGMRVGEVPAGVDPSRYTIVRLVPEAASEGT